MDRKLTLKKERAEKERRGKRKRNREAHRSGL